MKVAIKALNREHGKEVIKYLESIGGNNVYGMEGTGIKYPYYYITEFNSITNDCKVPEGYTLIELPKNNKTMYKPFAITGSQPLLKAMEETLVKEGFISDSTYSFIKGDDKANRLVSNILNPTSKGDFLKLCATHISTEKNQTFNLPEQWNEALEFILGQLKPKIEVGSWVVVLKLSDFSKNKIGEVKQVVEIKDNVNLNGNFCRGYRLSVAGGYWEPLENIRLATPEEIEAAQTVKIGNYKAEKTGDYITFGCQSFTKEELQAYKKLLNNNINAKIKISGTTITKDILNRLINKL